MTLRELVQQAGGINSPKMDNPIKLANKTVKYPLEIKSDNVRFDSIANEILIVLTADDIDKIYFGVN